jgi:hypothetical protein
MRCVTNALHLSGLEWIEGDVASVQFSDSELSDSGTEMISIVTSAYPGMGIRVEFDDG